MIRRQQYPNLPTQTNLTLPNLLCQTQKYGGKLKKKRFKNVLPSSVLSRYDGFISTSEDPASVYVLSAK
jgi:hypothetical protein